MNVTTAIGQMARPIGFDIAQGNDILQADLLNGFATGFCAAMPNETDRRMQCAYLAQLLTPAAKSLMRDIAGMCEDS